MLDPDFNPEASTTMNCPPGYDCNTAIEVGLGNYQTETNDYWYVFSPDQMVSTILTPASLTVTQSYTSMIIVQDC